MQQTCSTKYISGNEQSKLCLIISIRWVNYQGLLEACLVGKLVDTPSEPVPVVEKTFLLPPSGESDVYTISSPNRETAALKKSLTFKRRLSYFLCGACSGKQALMSHILEIHVSH